MKISILMLTWLLSLHQPRFRFIAFYSAKADPASFPLGTGPKPQEIWQEGYYPVAWTNKHFRMVYINMGHNDIDYEHGTNRELSYTFANPLQNRFIINSLVWLGTRR